MPRRARLWQWTEAACYHVINRGHARETVFHDDEDRARFLQLLAEYRDRFELRIYHYCLMGNHFHVLLQLPDPRGVSRVMAGLLVAYLAPLPQALWPGWTPVSRSVQESGGRGG